MRPLLCLLALLATAAQAQVTSLDEGSFTLMRGGERLGREDFSIRTSAAGSGLVAHAVITMGNRRIEPKLNADSTGGVQKYETEVRDGGKTVVMYSGTSARDHFQARSSRPEGESSREFRLPAGTIATEDDVVHQLWFVARRGPGASVAVLSPLRNVIETVRVELVGNERVSIDSHDIEARHLRLRTQESGATKDVWIDAAGHLLKVSIAASKFLAVRDEVPR